MKQITCTRTSGALLALGLTLTTLTLVRAEPMSQDLATSNSQPDNTARNARDRDDKSLTPLDQGNSKEDIATTAQIRKAILNENDMSGNAKNVKIITNNGHVTLRGPVDSAVEKRVIGEIANRAAKPNVVDNQLEVKLPAADSKN